MRGKRSISIIKTYRLALTGKRYGHLVQPGPALLKGYLIRISGFRPRATLSFVHCIL